MGDGVIYIKWKTVRSGPRYPREILLAPARFAKLINV